MFTISDPFIDAVIEGNYNYVENFLKKSPESANKIVYKFHPEKKQYQEFTPLLLSYVYTNEKVNKVRELLIEYGASVNCQYEDGSNYGHCLAKAAVLGNAYRFYAGLIQWIQDGGRITKADDKNVTPLRMITKMKKSLPGYFSTRAILIALDKRYYYPKRFHDNKLDDNFNEIQEIWEERKTFFNKIDFKPPDLKFAYKYDTVAHRALKELFLENGADINAPINEALVTLGHIFAIEAANRNTERYFIRLIKWLQDGGDRYKKDKDGCTPKDFITLCKKELYCEFQLPGFKAVCAILDTVEETDNLRVNNPLHLAYKALINKKLEEKGLKIKKLAKKKLNIPGKIYTDFYPQLEDRNAFNPLKNNHFELFYKAVEKDFEKMLPRKNESRNNKRVVSFKDPKDSI